MAKLNLPILTFLFSLSIVNMAVSQAFLPGYQYRKPVALQGTLVNGNHTGFPVLISLAADADLQARAQADGFDIRFTDTDGSTLLDHQLVRYEPATGALIAWVKVNLTHQTNKLIFLNYGAETPVVLNPSSATTWNNGFAAVYHFENDFLDATANARNGANNGSADVEGKIGRARNFTGINDRVEIGNWSVAGNQLTLSAWIRHSTIENNDPRIISKATNVNEQDHVWSMGHRNGGGGRVLGGRIKTGNNDAAGTSTHLGTTQLVADTWYHTAMTYDGANVRVFVNGNLEGTFAKTGDLRENAWNIWIGNGSNGTRNFHGQIDEVKIIGAARSAEWIQTEYNNQNTPHDFALLGVEEPVCNIAGTASPINGFLADGQATLINLNGNAPATTAIQWQSSSDLVTWADVSGATNNSFTTPPLVVGTYYYRALVTAGCTAPSSVATVMVGPAFMAGYCYRKSITVDPGKVTGNLTNYPMLVSLTDNDLRTVAHGGFVQSPDAHDIRFTDFAGNELNRQIERYNPQTGELIAWVRVPALSASNNTLIYLYFGNAAAPAPAAAFVNGTWDAGYRGIWHLDGPDAATALNDATAFGNHALEGAAGATNRIPGKIGTGRSFTGVNGSNSFLRVPNNPAFNGIAGQPADYTGSIGRQITLEAWGRLFQPANDDSPFIVLSPGINEERYMLGVDGGSDPLQVNRRLTTNSADRFWTLPGLPPTVGHFRYDNFTPLNDTWNHFVMVYDADYNNSGENGQLRTYVNGELVFVNNEPNGTIRYTANDLWFGRRNDGRRFKGVIDELRISNTVRSPEWIATQYNNQNSPATFYAVGPLSFTEQPGMATAFDELLDESESTTLNLTGFATGASIQWQSSADGVNFTDIGGAISSTYETPLLTSTTFYRAKVNLGACDAFSNVLEVVVREAFFAEPPVIYTFRREITIDYTKVSGSNNLTNFPMLVSVTDADLRTTANGGKVRDANGWDIIFTDENGVKLDHELERFVAASGTLMAWVKIPVLKASSNTIIYMYYGACGVTLTNPSTKATFNNNYTGVYHLENATAIDSSPIGNDGTRLGGINDANIVAGQISNATQINGGDQRFQFAGVNNPQVAGGNPRTVQIWAKIDNFGGDNRGFFQAGTDANDFSIRTSNVNNNFRIGVGAIDPDPVFTFGGALGQWRMYHLTYEGGINPVRIYYDGELFDVIGLGAALNTPGANLLLGRWVGNSMQGAIDEFRVSSVARSSDWIKTEYNNQRDPASFYTLGPQTAEYVWTGLSADANTNWADAENWSGCEVPIAGADIRIPDIHPRTNYPLLDQAREIGFIRVGPDDGNAPVPSVDANGNPLTIRGNLRNDGLVTGAVGSYILAGNRNQRQRISGVGTSDFPNLTLNNPRGAFLAKNISVANQLGFTNGHLALFNFDLQLEAGSNITGADANKFIVTNGTGAVCWDSITHNTALFPVGTRTEAYTPFEVTNQGTAAGFCIRVCENVHEDGTCAGTQIDQEVVHRTWQVTPSTQTGLDLTLTAHWSAPLQSGDFDGANAYLSRYVTGGWERISTFQDATTSFTATTTGLSHYPYATMSFAVGSNGSMLLPVSYLFFKGEHVAGVNRLLWETAQERNNAFFEVQRSANGQIFETIAALPGSGERNQPGAYQYLDTKPLSGTNYYRLRQIDRDGNASFSHVIATQVQRSQVIWVYPNPVVNGVLHIAP